MGQWGWRLVCSSEGGRRGEAEKLHRKYSPGQDIFTIYTDSAGCYSRVWDLMTAVHETQHNKLLIWFAYDGNNNNNAKMIIVAAIICNNKHYFSIHMNYLIQL